jgi:molybdate/tungstate transport system substrate-binding protein
MSLTIDGALEARGAAAALRRLCALRALAPYATMALALAACSRDAGRRTDARPSSRVDTLVVFNAASIARPMRAVLDSFAARNGGRVVVVQESQASLEIARRMTDLGQTPDVVALADDRVFDELLVPAQVERYARFARNRMVLAFTPRSKFAGEIDGENWRRVLQRPGVEVGRADPATDPSGYRALMLFQLAERFYREPGLAGRLLAAAPARNVRPREADQVGLLQTGSLDYAWTYESLANGFGLRFVRLPAAIDLGSLTDSAGYSKAVVRVPGRSRQDTLSLRGRPIVYGIGAATHAPHGAIAQRFLDFALSANGRRILRAHQLDVPDSIGWAGPRPGSSQ